MKSTNSSNPLKSKSPKSSLLLVVVALLPVALLNVPLAPEDADAASPSGTAVAVACAVPNGGGTVVANAPLLELAETSAVVVGRFCGAPANGRAVPPGVMSVVGTCIGMEGGGKEIDMPPGE